MHNRNEFQTYSENIIFIYSSLVNTKQSSKSCLRCLCMAPFTNITCMQFSDTELCPLYVYLQAIKMTKLSVNGTLCEKLVEYDRILKSFLLYQCYALSHHCAKIYCIFPTTKICLRPELFELCTRICYRNFGLDYRI